MDAGSQENLTRYLDSCLSDKMEKVGVRF